MAGQLPAFAGLGTLGHLDLDLVGVGQVFGGDPEAAGGHLLDGGAQAVACLERDIARDAAPADDISQGCIGLQGRESLAILATFARIRLAADAVHGHGKRAVRLG